MNAQQQHQHASQGILQTGPLLSINHPGTCSQTNGVPSLIPFLCTPNPTPLASVLAAAAASLPLPGLLNNIDCVNPATSFVLYPTASVQAASYASTSVGTSADGSSGTVTADADAHHTIVRAPVLYKNGVSHTSQAESVVR